MIATIKVFYHSVISTSKASVTDDWRCAWCRVPSMVVPCERCGSMAVGHLLEDSKLSRAIKALDTVETWPWNLSSDDSSLAKIVRTVLEA